MPRESFSDFRAFAATAFRRDDRMVWQMLILKECGLKGHRWSLPSSAIELRIR